METRSVAFYLALISGWDPAPEQRALFAALAKNPQAVGQFTGVLTGIVSINSYFAPGNLCKIIGPLGMARMVLQQATAPWPAALAT